MGDLYKCKNCGQLLYTTSEPVNIDGSQTADVLRALEKKGVYDSSAPVPLLESDFSEFLQISDLEDGRIRYTAYPTFLNVLKNMRQDDVMIGSKTIENDQEIITCTLCGSTNHFQTLGSLPTTETDGVWDNYVDTDHTWYILSDSLAGRGSITELERRNLNRYIARENQADVSEFVNRVMAKNHSSLEVNQAQMNQEDLDLTSFFQILMTIKTGIWLLENRFYDLIMRLMEIDRQIIKMTCRTERNIIEQIEDREEQYWTEIHDLENKLEFHIQPDWEKQYSCTYPEPVKIVVPEEPKEPEYKTAGFFNRQKIQQENDLLRQEYTEQMEQYHRICQEYEAALEAYNKEVELYERRKQEIFANEEAFWKNSKPYQDRKGQIAYLKKKLEVLKGAKEDAFSSSKKLTEDTPLSKISNFLREEGKEITGLLKDAYQVEADLQTLQFVLPKYLDAVAVTKIYEYLKSGRCTQLTGKDGAYILYDSELNSRKFSATGRDALLNQLSFQREVTIYSIMSAVADVYNNLTEKTDTVIHEMKQSADTDAELEDYKKAADDYYSLAREKIHESEKFLADYKAKREAEAPSE